MQSKPKLLDAHNLVFGFTHTEMMRALNRAPFGSSQQLFSC